MDGLGTILHAVWAENIQKRGTRREMGQIWVSSVQCIGIVKVMLAYINNGNSGVLLSSLTDSGRRCQTPASSPTPPFLVLPIRKQAKKSDLQSSLNIDSEVKDRKLGVV